MKKSKWSATHFRALSLLLLIGALGNDSSAAPGDVDLNNGSISVIVPTNASSRFYRLISEKKLDV